MKALVTGGAGFIGSNLVARLLREGWDVTVLDNLLSGHRENLAPFRQIEFIEGDVRDASTVEWAAEGASAIFHLAASVGNKRSIDLPIDDATINVLGTLNVLEAARKHGIPKVMFSSSAGIFGELKTLPISEDHPAEPDTPYGASKLCAEKNCLAYAKLYGIETVCFRYFNVYGPNQRFDAYGNVIPIFVFKALAGETITVFGDGEQTRDFINVADVVEANYLAATTPGVWGAFNLGSGTRVTINALIEQIGNALGFAPVVFHGPKRPGDVRDSLADISLVREKLGFEPSVTLANGLPEYTAWAQDQALVKAA
jgi:UDP-glucose 4-epimerase